MTRGGRKGTTRGGRAGREERRTYARRGVRRMHDLKALPLLLLQRLVVRALGNNVAGFVHGRGGPPLSVWHEHGPGLRNGKGVRDVVAKLGPQLVQRRVRVLHCRRTVLEERRQGWCEERSAGLAMGMRRMNWGWLLGWKTIVRALGPHALAPTSFMSRRPCPCRDAAHVLTPSMSRRRPCPCLDAAHVHI